MKKYRRTGKPAAEHTGGAAEGRILRHRDGFGFLIPDDRSGDIYLSRREMRYLWHGDRARVRVTREDHLGRLSGRVEALLSRGDQPLIGRVERHGGSWILVPNDPRYGDAIALRVPHHSKVNEGELIRAHLTQYPERHQEPVAQFDAALGDPEDPDAVIAAVTQEYELSEVWTAAVLAEIDRLPERVGAAERRRRRDLRDLAFVTIDGEDARDFDDAVFCHEEKDAWRLLVAIADVGHYVKPGSAVDQEAQHRGTSVYFPKRVIPMLPEQLSNDLCSLRPDEDRLCLVCEMLIDANGETREYQFHRGVIRSHARLTYTAVQQFLDGDVEFPVPIAERINALNGLHAALQSARTARGVLEFELPEPQIVTSDDGEILNIQPRPRATAHTIIEECMIAANRAAANFLAENELPTLYRVHDRPDAEKLRGLRQLLMEFGLTLDGGETPDAADLRAVLEAVAGTPHENIVEMAVLRSLKRAVYTEQEQSHFGIALEQYCHFTSPIRRYPDLLVHRGIVHLLHGRKSRSFTYDQEQMAQLATQCSQTEQRAEQASRHVLAWYKTRFMQRHLGEEFAGVISGVTAFGLFVTLPEHLVDGLVHISSLPVGDYQFEAERHRLSARHGPRFSLGDRLRVQVAAVNLDERKIDLVLA